MQMIRTRPWLFLACFSTLIILSVMLREPATLVYQNFLTWIYSEQRAYHELMRKSLSAFADETGWSAGFSIVVVGFLYGIFHAAGPGHGKVILSTYLLTQPERVGKSVFMSVASAMMQGLVAVLLVYGLFYVFGIVSRDANLAVVWSERLSFALIIGLGLVLAWRALRGLGWIGNQGHDHSNHDHSGHHHHGHDHHHDHSHDGDGVCSTCGHAHMPTPDQLESATNWRAVLSVIVSIGLRPCSGAVLMLVFAKFAGIPFAGVMAVFAISTGTAITVSLLAIMAVKARGLAQAALGATAGRIDLVGNLVALAGGVILILLGYGLLASSWSETSMRSMGL